MSLNHSRSRVLKIKVWLLILVDFNIGDFVLKSPIANIYSPPIFHLIRYGDWLIANIVYLKINDICEIKVVYLLNMQPCYFLNVK